MAYDKLLFHERYVFRRLVGFEIINKYLPYQGLSFLKTGSSIQLLYAINRQKNEAPLCRRRWRHGSGLSGESKKRSGGHGRARHKANFQTYQQSRMRFAVETRGKAAGKKFSVTEECPINGFKFLKNIR